MIISGKLNATEPEVSFAGHRVKIIFEENIRLVSEPIFDDDGNPIEADDNSLWQTAIRTTSLSPEGTFTIDIVDAEDDELRGPFIIDVLAPDGQVLFRQSFADIQENIELDVDPQVPATPEAIQSRPQFRLTGQVVDRENARIAAHMQVLLWARHLDAPEDQFHVVLVLTTDSNGKFSGDYPMEQYADAYGQVGSEANEPIPILLDDGFFPQRIVLVTDLDDVTSIDDDGVPRLPDHVDFANSPDVYSGDLGPGSCVNFTTPNRTLEEFSYYQVVRTTDPEIKGLTLDEPRPIPAAIKRLLSKVTFDDVLFNRTTVAKEEESGGDFIVFRAQPADIESPTSGLFARPQPILKEEYLETDIRINADILRSIAEDPDNFTPMGLMTADRQSAFTHLLDIFDNMKKTVGGRDVLDATNVVDWDETPTFYQATTIAHGHILNFKQIWKSNGYSIGDLLYSLPLAPGQQKRIVVIDWDRLETGVRRESEVEFEALRATIARDRDVGEIVSTVLNESMSGGSSASNSSVAGGIGAGGIGAVSGAVFGALIGIAGGASNANASAWQRNSRALSGQSMQRLRDTTIQSAGSVRNRRSSVVQAVGQSEAVEVSTEVVANNNHCHAMTVEYFEVLRHLLISQELVDVQECLFIPLMISKFDAAKVLRWREILQRYLRDRSLRRGFDALERMRTGYEDTDFPLGRYADEAFEFIDAELTLMLDIRRPRDRAEGESVTEHVSTSWNIFGIILELNNSEMVKLYNNFIEGQEFKDRIFNTDLAPRIASAFVNSIKVELENGFGTRFEVELDPTLVSNYRAGRQHFVKLSFRGSVPAILRSSVEKIVVSTDQNLSPGSQSIVKRVNIRYRTEHYSGTLFSSRNRNDDLVPGDPMTLPVFLSRAEKRNPRQEDRDFAKRLLAHLNENIEYYHRAIWWQMSEDRRFMLLDGYIAPNSGGRSLASVVENRVIGIVGNCLVMPVARSFKLDPTYELEFNEETGEYLSTLNDLYEPDLRTPPYHVAIPTNGVFAEAVMGSCNSCEKIDDSRFWRWHEHPIPDNPANITDISADSRRQNPPNLEPTERAPSIINIQDIPTAPDPTGISALLQVLANPNLFRDISGLTHTQQSAISALQSAFGTAEFFGGAVASMLTNRKNLDKTLKSIKKAHDDGMLTTEDAQELAQKALSGAAPPERQPEKKLTQDPSINKLLEKASTDPNSSVKLHREGDGQSDTVEVKRRNLGVGQAVTLAERINRAANDVVEGYEYGPQWLGRRPPGLPADARQASRRGAAEPFVRQLAADTGLGDIFTRTVVHLAQTESYGARFGLPADTYDTRPPQDRPEDKPYISAWGVFQFNRDAWHAYIDNSQFPWDATPVEEIQHPINRYAMHFREIRAAGGDDIAAARGIRLWHQTPAGYNTYRDAGRDDNFDNAWNGVDQTRRTRIDNHLTDAGILPVNNGGE